MLIRSVYRFHVYFHMRLILFKLKVALPHEERYKKTKNLYSEKDYLELREEYGADPDETWLFGNWYTTTNWAVFGDNNRKRTKAAPPKNLTRWILRTSKGFTRTGVAMISKSVRAYVYILLTSQAQARSKIVGKTASAIDAQNIYVSTFEELIKSEYLTADDIARYQGVLEHAMSKVDFSVGEGIYMLPSNMNLTINKTRGFNNNILISGSSYKLGINSKVNAAAQLLHEKKSSQEDKIPKLLPHEKKISPGS